MIDGLSTSFADRVPLRGIPSSELQVYLPPEDTYDSEVYALVDADGVLLEAGVTIPVIVLSDDKSQITWEAHPDAIYSEIAFAPYDSPYETKEHIMCTTKQFFKFARRGAYFVRHRFLNRWVSRWSKPKLCEVPVAATLSGYGGPESINDVYLDAGVNPHSGSSFSDKHYYSQVNGDYNLVFGDLGGFYVWYVQLKTDFGNVGSSVVISDGNVNPNAVGEPWDDTWDSGISVTEGVA